MKPSIFSREYEKKMKKRKKRIALALSCIVIAVLIIGTSMKGWIKNINLKGRLNIKSFSITGLLDHKKNTPESKISNLPTENQNKKDTEEKAYDLTLKDGTKLQVIYEVKDKNPKFKYVSPIESNVYFNISPTGKSIVIFDDKEQSSKYMDISGKVLDIFKKEYISTDGTVFIRDAVMQKNPGYVWMDSPKLIDDEHVAYISQLPWISDKITKYVWIYNTTTKEDLLYEEVGSDTLKFGNVAEKGLSVIIDGKTRFLHNDGSVTD